MSDFWFGLWMLVQGAWWAGVIYPASIRLGEVSRWKILGIGFVLSFFILIGVAIFTGTEGESEPPGVFPILMGLISTLWWFVAIVGLLNAWAKRWAKRAPKPTKPAVEPVTKAPSSPDQSTKDHWLTKVPKAAKESKPTAQYRATSRAIASGWSLGEIEFTYEDAEGEITHRRVTVHSVSTLYIKGECHDRLAERTFRIDRILGNITDCETGEILSPKAYSKSMR